MNKKERENDSRAFSRFLDRAYIRDGKTVHTGEAVLLACILHAKGKSRASDDMTDVQRIMRDHNLDRK
jgi:hypothetical protein